MLKGSLKKVGLILAHGLRMQSIMTGRLAAGARGNWSHSVHSQEAENHQCWYSAPAPGDTAVVCVFPPHLNLSENALRYMPGSVFPR